MLVLNTYFVGVSEFIGMCVVWGILECLIVYPAAMGWLPGGKGMQASSFSEQTAAKGLSFLSFFPWIAHATEQTFIVFHWVLNGSLALIVAVYCIAKSLISKRLRLEVFKVLIIPILQINIAQSGILS